MFIEQFMTRDVVTLNRQSDIAEARRLMLRYRIRHIPVTRADNTLIGLVSDRDVRSAMPSRFFPDRTSERLEEEAVTGIVVQEIMTKDPVCISIGATIQDALILVEKTRVGAFPVVDADRKVAGIVSDRDLLNAFIRVLGIKEPGALLGVVIEEKIEQMGRLIDTIVGENISFGSILVYRDWSPGKRAVFPYLLAKNVGHLKKKLTEMGYEVLEPVQWYVERHG